jgi:hypothetical protein
MRRKLTAELLAAVAEATERGGSARQIAAAVGVSERSVVAAWAQLRERGRRPTRRRLARRRTARPPEPDWRQAARAPASPTP